MSRITALLAPFVAAMALIVATASPADACSCRRQTTAEQYTRAHVVFAGKISRLEYEDGPLPYPPTSARIRWQRARFDVAEAWKGVNQSPVVVYMGGSEGLSCGYDLTTEVDYLVLGVYWGSDQRLMTSYCEGTTRLLDDTLTRFGLVSGQAVGTTVEGAEAQAKPATGSPASSDAPVGYRVESVPESLDLPVRPLLLAVLVGVVIVLGMVIVRRSRRA